MRMLMLVYSGSNPRRISSLFNARHGRASSVATDRSGVLSFSLSGGNEFDRLWLYASRILAGVNCRAAFVSCCTELIVNPNQRWEDDPD